MSTLARRAPMPNTRWHGLRPEGGSPLGAKTRRRLPRASAGLGQPVARATLARPYRARFRHGGGTTQNSYFCRRCPFLVSSRRLMFAGCSRGGAIVPRPRRRRTNAAPRCRWQVWGLDHGTGDEVKRKRAREAEANKQSEHEQSKSRSHERSGAAGGEENHKTPPAQILRVLRRVLKYCECDSTHT